MVQFTAQHTRTRARFFFVFTKITALHTTHAKGCAGRHIKGVLKKEV